jgi:hypothetical protein
MTRPTWSKSIRMPAMVLVESVVTTRRWRQQCVSAGAGI